MGDGAKRQHNITLDDLIDVLVEILAANDPYTVNHSRRVKDISLRLLKLSGIDINHEDMRFGALLHDIGKIYMPESILVKPSELNLAERDTVRRHPIYGVKALGKEPLRKFGSVVYNCILYHHRYFDGSGFPDFDEHNNRITVKGNEIPPEARIVTIADHFDALISNRAYRPAFSCDEALEIMNRQKCLYDPVLFEIFRRDLFPELKRARRTGR